MVPYKHINVLIMPTDYCNMNCVYCFNGRRTAKEKNVMSTDTLRKIFLSVIPYYHHVRFIWHGGEPTSVEIDFYRNAIKMQNEINQYDTVIENSIQTNLTLADEEMIRFFLEHDFHIGSSFDGTANDLTRHNSEKILAGRERVIRCGGRVGFICVVQSKNVDRLIEDYEWFKSKGINYTLNTYLASPPFEKDNLFVPAPKQISAICDLYDYWSKDQDCNIHISFFDEFIDHILFGKKSLCCYNSCLGKHIGVRYDGAIFNCNRDFSEEFCYGNIHDYDDVHECFESDGFKKSVACAYQRRKHCMANCDVYDFCEGGCNSCSVTYGDMSKPNDYYCEITKAVYHHIKNSLNDLKKQTSVSEQINSFLNQKLQQYASSLSQR